MMDKKEDSQSQGFILVAEGSAPNRNVLTNLLEKLGYNICACPDGDAAWEVIETTHEKIIAIFSDFMMPNIDGLGLLKQVRRLEKFKDIPFFLISKLSS